MRLLFLLAMVCPAPAAEFTIAPSNGRVEAIVEKTGLMSGKKHLLRWNAFDGRISDEPATVRLEVDAASVQVLDDWINDGKKADVRKETLGPNVLDTRKHPKIVFESRTVSGDPQAVFQVSGVLRIRGIEKPVALAVRKTPDGYEGETQFPMSSFGIKPPKAALGAVGTKDLMTIRFAVKR